MLTLSIFTLVVTIVLAALAFDATGSGILYIAKARMTARGLAWLSVGTSLWALALLALSRDIPLPSRLTTATWAVCILAAGAAITISIMAKRIQEARFKQRIADEGKKAEGIRWVGLIIRLLKEKGVESVSFDRRSYDTALGKEELPWCHRWDAFIETVRLSQYDENAIVMDVTYKDRPMASSFDGTETEENFEHLFFDIYDEITDPEKNPTPDEWLESAARADAAQALIRSILCDDDIVDASYDAGSDTLTVTVPQRVLGLSDDGMTGVTAERYHLFCDLGYWRVAYENGKGVFRKACGMFAGNTVIHPDIAGDENLAMQEPRWLSRILGECDWAGITPTHIDVVEA